MMWMGISVKEESVLGGGGGRVGISGLGRKSRSERRGVFFVEGHEQRRSYLLQ